MLRDLTASVPVTTMQTYILWTRATPGQPARKFLKRAEHSGEAVRAVEARGFTVSSWSAATPRDTEALARFPAHDLDGCQFPDCGCPEARLCMARDPNTGAMTLLRCGGE